MPQETPIHVVIGKEIVFFWTFLLVIFSWVLIDLWGRWINNFTFEYMLLNPKSTYHTFIIAIAFTLIMMTFFTYFRSLGYNFTAQITGGVIVPEVEDSMYKMDDENVHDDKYPHDLISNVEPVDFIETASFPGEI